MNRAVRWFVRRAGGATLLVLALLAIALVSLAWILSAIVRGLDFELMFLMTLVGMSCGWVMARSRLHRLFFAPSILVIALATALVRVGQLGGQLAGALAALSIALWRARFGQWQFNAVAEGAAPLLTGIGTLALRVQEWARAMLSGQARYEPVAMALVWSLIVFLTAAWAAWRIRRSERAFDALLPVVVLLASVIAYSGRELWIMVIIVSVWLGLLFAVPLFARQRMWERQAVPFAEDLGIDLAFVAVPAIFILVAAAISVPVISPSEFERLAREWNSSTSNSSIILSNSFGIEPEPKTQPEPALLRASSPGLPRSHLLGASPELLNKLALTVQSDDLIGELPALYWLGTTYDEYSGHGWYSSGFRQQEYPAETPIESETPFASRHVHQSVQVDNGSGIVYAAGVLERIDSDSIVAWRQPGDMFAAQANSNSFQADSYVPVADANALKTASQDYPSWIGSQYLRLPADLPPRVTALARDLTATAPTPYDRARAIENYLHTIPYSLDVPLPPAGHDVTDYFLFDLRRGYCDYYATAMAVLARAAGLPARIAVGYAAGEYNAQTHTYRVVEANAHSWTQVYFPGYGWVDFEPTTGRTVIERNAVPEVRQTPTFSSSGAFFSGSGSQPMASAILLLFGAVLGTVVLLLLIAAGDSLYLGQAYPDSTVQILYRRMVWAAERGGVPETKGLTPHQIGEQVAASFAGRRDARFLTRMWRPVQSVMNSIVVAYDRRTYGALTLDMTEHVQLIRKWQAIRLRLVAVLALRAVVEQWKKWTGAIRNPKRNDRVA